MSIKESPNKDLAISTEKLSNEDGFIQPENTDREDSTNTEKLPASGMPSKAEEPEPQYITGMRLYLVSISITLAVALLFLDVSIVATAIPRITDQFNSLSDVGWYGGAYQLGSAVFMPLTGKIYTYFSSKWSFLSFFAVFEVGSLLCGAAVNSPMLIVGRAIAGLGGSGVLSGGLTILASCLPLNKRATTAGIIMGVSQLGVVLGPLLGGVLTENNSWRWCFYVNLPLGVPVALFILLLQIPDQIRKPDPLFILSRLHHHLDIVGFTIFAGSVVQLLLAFEFAGSRYSWNSWTIIGLFCGAVVTFAIWLIWNWRQGDNALIPISMVSKQVVWTSSLTQAFSMVPLIIVSYFLPLYFQAVQNASPIQSGLKLLPSIVSQLIFAILVGIAISKTGFTIPYAVVGSAMAAVGSGLLSTLGPDGSIGQWFGYQILTGVGRGITVQMPIMAIQAALKPGEISMANSLMMLIQFLLQSIMLVVGNTLLDTSLRSQIAQHAPGVDVNKVFHAGATGYRSIVSATDLPGVVLAYSNSINKVFYIGAAGASLAVLVAPGMGWMDIRKKSAGQKTSEAQDDSKAAIGKQDIV